MDGLPPTVAESLAAHVGSPVRYIGPVHGGMICRAVQVACGDARLFVKWAERAPTRFFSAEVAGLDLLRSTGAIRVPAVALASDTAPVAFLALEWIETGDYSAGRRPGRSLGEKLAALHRPTAGWGAGYGLDQDNFLGHMPQPNGAMPTWGAFFRDRRIAPQIEAARVMGLPAHRERLFAAVLERAAERLGGLQEGPCVIHGDLWAGNVLHTPEGPALVDPAAYRGEREVELAYTQLFGGFDRDFYEAYRSCYPLAEGYERRRPVHQLYHLLAHLNHFGADQYGAACDDCCRAILAA